MISDPKKPQKQFRLYIRFLAWLAAIAAGLMLLVAGVTYWFDPNAVEIFKPLISSGLLTALGASLLFIFSAPDPPRSSQ